MFKHTKFILISVWNFFINVILQIILVIGGIYIIYIKFSNIDKFTNIDASEIGTFLTGIAATLGLIFGKLAFKEYRKQQRSKAAVSALLAFESFVKKVIIILEAPGLYEYEKYYPFSKPEISDENNKKDWVRPSRLIGNYWGIFKSKLHSSIIEISGNESIELSNLSNELELCCRNIYSWLQAQNHPDKKEIIKNRDYDLSLDKLEKICAKAKKILTPIIKRGY